MLRWTPSTRLLQSSTRFRPGASRPFSLYPLGAGRTSKLAGTIVGLTASYYIVDYYAHFWKNKYFATPLNGSTFTDFKLVSKEPVSSTSSIYRLQPTFDNSSTSETIAEAFKKGVWSVQFKQPYIQIARNYTPLPPSSDHEYEDGELRVFFRRETGGEMSKYLHGLAKGAGIEVRGPFLELEIPEDITEILFLAGGTGIAPALQIAHLLKERKETNMHIIWANRKREDCFGGKNDTPTNSKSSGGSLLAWVGIYTGILLDSPRGQRGTIVELLEDLKTRVRPGQLTVDYYVDEENSLVKPKNVIDVLQQRDSNQVGKQRKRKLILISGPDGFVDYWAGNHREPLAGILGQMNLNGWQVVRLGDI